MARGRHTPSGLAVARPGDTRAGGGECWGGRGRRSGVKRPLKFLSAEHRNFEPMRPGTGDRFRITSVGVPRYPQTRVSSEHSLQAARRLGGTIGHNHLPGMDAIANTHTATMVQTDPGGPAHRIDEGV